MNGIRAVCISAAMLAAAVGASAADMQYTVKPWFELADRSVSGAARDLMEGRHAEFVHAGNGRLTVHGTALPEVDRVIREADFAYTFCRRELGAQTVDLEPLHIFVVQSASVWSNLLTRQRWREDGFALASGREIFLFRDRESVERRIDIPHEMVHFILSQMDYHRLPLWLEEGLALYIGARTAQSYAVERGYELDRRLPELAVEDLFDLDHLTTRKTLPHRPGRRAAFYRQSERLVQFIFRHAPRDRMLDLLTAFSRSRESWDDTVVALFEWPAETLEKARRAIRSENGDG